MPVAERFILEDVIDVLLGRKPRPSRTTPSPERVIELLASGTAAEQKHAMSMLSALQKTHNTDELIEALRAVINAEYAPVMGYLNDLKQQADNKAREEAAEPDESALRQRMLAHRYGKHQVTDRHTLVLLQDYKPNLASMPDGWVEMGDYRTGRLYQLYFKLYSPDDLNPLPEGKHFQPQGYEATGPNRGYGLDLVKNPRMQEDFVYRTIRRNLGELLKDDELTLLSVTFRPTHAVDPVVVLRTDHQDEASFYMEGGIRVIVGGHMAPGNDIVTLSTMHESGAVACQFALHIDLHLPDDADLSGIDLYAVARRVAQYQCVAHPQYVGSGNLTITSYRFAPKPEGTPYTNGRGSAMYAVEPLHIVVPL